MAEVISCLAIRQFLHSGSAKPVLFCQYLLYAFTFSRVVFDRAKRVERRQTFLQIWNGFIWGQRNDFHGLPFPFVGDWLLRFDPAFMNTYSNHGYLLTN